MSGKTAASFSGIHNVEKVNLISHGEKKNAEEDRKKQKVLVPTMGLLADVTFRHVCSHLGAAERNLFGPQDLLRLKCLARSDPQEDAVIG